MVVKERRCAHDKHDDRDSRVPAADRPKQNEIEDNEDQRGREHCAEPLWRWCPHAKSVDRGNRISSKAVLLLSREGSSRWKLFGAG